MANYLQLVNRALARLNEVVLDSSTFTTAAEFHMFMKDAVNDSIRDIYEEEHKWPFLLQTAPPVNTVAGTQVYSLADDVGIVDWDSFYISHDTDITAKKLKYIDLQYWRDYLQADDLERIANGSSSWGKPDYVFRDPAGSQFGISTVPDATYAVNYKYWKTTTDLSAFDDTPDIPEKYHHIIVDRLLFYGYMFREDFQSAKIYDNKYSKGISRMRTELINYQNYMRG